MLTVRFYDPDETDEDGTHVFPDRVYDVAQVCLNGHIVNDRFRAAPAGNRTFCPQCGTRTLTQCHHCGAPIPGFLYRYQFGHGFDHFETGDPLPEAPRFCGECGKEMPWTETRLQAARDFILEWDDIPTEDRTRLVESLPDIVRDTPRSELAALRVKRALAKAKKPGSEIFLKMIAELATSGMLKILGMNNVAAI